MERNGISHVLHQIFLELIKKQKSKKNLVDGYVKDPLDAFLEEYIPTVLDESAKAQESLVKPVTFKLNYTVTVDANAVPDGEIIKCWLPFPREGHQRQTEIKLLAVNNDEYIIASNDNPQRTLFMQKPAMKDQPTIFNMVLEVTNYNEMNLILPDFIKPYNKESGLYKTLYYQKEHRT